MRSSVPRPLRGLLVAALVALTLLAGCSSDGSGSGAPAAPPRAPADANAFPVTIPTAFGDVTVAEAPQRVVALGWSDADTALALGVPPVGAADWLGVGGDGVGAWNTARYPSPPTMLGTMEVDLEAVTALAPDLILDTRGSGAQERHDQLARLGVPVVSIPPGAANYLTTWDQQLEMVGAALGRPAAAQQLEAGTQGKFDAARAAHPAFDGTTAAVGARSATSGYSAYVAASNRLQFMQALGFVPSPAIERQAAGDFFVSVSSEQMNLFDAGLTVMQPISGDGAAIENDPLYRAIPSVAAGRGVVLTDPTLSSAFSSASATGWSYALDRVVPAFAAAVGPR